MRIGDIEYTRRIRHIGLGTLNVSQFESVSFALGIKVRPLLTRVQAIVLSDVVTVENTIAYLENGDAVGAGLGVDAMNLDTRLLPILFMNKRISTNGFAVVQGPVETRWWKIMMPDVRLHFVSSTQVTTDWVVTLHYRFAELTDDEIIEIAAQRAQS